MGGLSFRAGGAGGAVGFRFDAGVAAGVAADADADADADIEAEG